VFSRTSWLPFKWVAWGKTSASPRTAGISTFHTTVIIRTQPTNIDYKEAQGEDRPEICELLDSWADRAYTLYGDAVATEIAHVATEIFAEVHRSNMSKTKASKNELGKGKKGDEFQSPRLSQFFDAPTDG